MTTSKCKFCDQDYSEHYDVLNSQYGFCTWTCMKEHGKIYSRGVHPTEAKRKAVGKKARESSDTLKTIAVWLFLIGFIVFHSLPAIGVLIAFLSILSFTISEYM
jgi:hypothetical protein